MTYNLSDDVSLDGINNFVVEDRDDFVYPNIIDYKDFCLPTNNQRGTPHCVGYTVAGYLEVNYWKIYHKPVQFDAKAIYDLGRKYKADTIDGTKIEYCLLEAKKEKIIDGNILSFKPKTIREFKYVVHQYGVMMCGLNITNEWYNLNSDYIIKESKRPKVLGKHCVLCCGYSTKGVDIQNSWGFKKWGNYGFGVVPWDMWIKQIECCIFVDNLTFNTENLCLNYKKKDT